MQRTMTLDTDVGCCWSYDARAGGTEGRRYLQVRCAAGAKDATPLRLRTRTARLPRTPIALSPCGEGWRHSPAATRGRTPGRAQRSTQGQRWGSCWAIPPRPKGWDIWRGRFPLSGAVPTGRKRSPCRPPRSRRTAVGPDRSCADSAFCRAAGVLRPVSGALAEGSGVAADDFAKRCWTVAQVPQPPVSGGLGSNSAGFSGRWCEQLGSTWAWENIAISAD